MDTYNNEWNILTPEEKRHRLYERQKVMLRGSLERNAISKEQHEKSFGDLIEKMGYGAES